MEKKMKISTILQAARAWKKGRFYAQVSAPLTEKKWRWLDLQSVLGSWAEVFFIPAEHLRAGADHDEIMQWAVPVQSTR